MEFKLELTPPDADSVAPRASFVATLATLAVDKPAAETASARKPGSFLTRRFFGGKDKKDAAPAGPQPPIAMRPEPASEDLAATLTGTSRGQPGDPAIQVAEVAPDTVQTSPGDRTPVESNVPADAAGNVPTPPDVPTPATTDLPPPRITVPSFHHPTPDMTPDPSTIPPPAGRATAQLTLGFEITSLQLSPFFRLSAVQLKALSNVVSLHLVTAQPAGQPLAAGISFQIERVEVDDAARLKTLLLKPLTESRESAAPVSSLQVESVAITGEREDAPISVTTSGAASTVVHLVGTFAIAGMDFSPAFEIDSLRLEPTANTVLLRVAPSSDSGAQGLPSSFEIDEVQLDDSAHIRGARLVPSMAGNV